LEASDHSYSALGSRLLIVSRIFLARISDPLTRHSPGYFSPSPEDRCSFRGHRRCAQPRTRGYLSLPRAKFTRRSWPCPLPLTVRTGVSRLTVHTSGTHVQDARQSSFAASSHSRCLEVIFDDHERTLASSLLKMEAEVNSQLGRSWIAMKNKKPRLHLCLGHGLVSSK
jgi:hypothetical protein